MLLSDYFSFPFFSVYLERLKTLRSELGLTQKQAAEQLNLTERGYQYYEQGTRKPNYDALITLADALTT